MKLKRTLSFIIALIMALSCLASCADRSPEVLTLEKHKVTEAMYGYWASRFKGNYMSAYNDVDNSDAFWNSEVQEGLTAAEYLDGLTLESVKTYLVCSLLFDKYRLAFEKDELQSIDNYISDLIKEYADGSKNVMNTVLGKYGINTKILKNVYLEEEKVAKVFNYLYGEGGEMALTEEDYEQFYKENFVHVQMIYVENISRYKTDANGNRITDDDGHFQIEPMTGEEKEKKDAVVNAVMDGLEAGEDFNSLYEKYSELTDYDNGHYYSTVTDYGGETVYYSIVAKVSGIDVGEVVSVESEMGTCIVQKLEMDSGAWKDEKNEDFFIGFEDSAQQYSFLELIKSYYEKIEINEEILEKYSVRNVAPASFF